MCLADVNLEAVRILRRMVRAIDNYVADHDGESYFTDTGCIECTCGTVPDRDNTGPCAYHQAKQLLAKVS